MEIDYDLVINDCLGLSLIEENQNQKTYRIKLAVKERIRIIISNYCWFDYSASALDLIIKKGNISLLLDPSEKLPAGPAIRSVQKVKEINFFREPHLNLMPSRRIIIVFEFEGDYFSSL